jgi:hypothetical protein
MDELKRDLEIRAMMQLGEDIESGAHQQPISNPGTNPANVLLDAMRHAEKTGSPNGFIENMEAKGQQEFVKAAGARLPTSGTVEAQFPHREDPETNQALLENLGFVFGDKISGDEIWVEATLPEGWEVKATDHSMWSSLVDDKGRKRGGIFYKAAFYDRSCHLTLDRRFSVGTKPVK